MKKRTALAILWLLLILVATLTPGDRLPSTPKIIGFDKLVHFSLFAILAFLWCRVAIGKGFKKLNIKKIITNYLVFCFLFAILVEYLQRHIPGRSFDYADMTANIIGIAIGTISFIILHRKRSNLV